MADLKPCSVVEFLKGVPTTEEGMFILSSSFIIANVRALSHPVPVQAEQSLEVVAWNLECQTLGGDTGWILSWSRSGAGLCNRLSGVEHEVALTDHAKATAALAQKEAEIAALQDVVT